MGGFAMPKAVRIFESVFDIAYLCFDLIAAVIFFARADGRTVLYLFGILTILLGGGDAFHLIPRVKMQLHDLDEKTKHDMNLGVAITSVTMTGFYLILTMIWRQLFPKVEAPQVLFIIIWVTGALRIILCMFPQNRWFSGGSARWSFYRNFPFAICGFCVAMLFLISGNTGGYSLYKMAIAIFISFGCYLPVTIWSKKTPAIGVLMMPKTCAYIWMIAMGLSLIPVL